MAGSVGTDSGAFAHASEASRLGRSAARAEWAAVIDLRSDTVTRPTPACAPRSPPPSSVTSRCARTRRVNELQERVAALLGQEQALFLPTATMANQIALKLHGAPRRRALAEEHSHVVIYEFGGAAVHAGLLTRRAARARRGASRRPGARRGADRRGRRRPAPRRARAREHPQRRRRPRLAARRARRRRRRRPRRRSRRAPRRSAAAERGGRARCPAAAIGARVDTVTLCLSKGLGCPLGALLAGPAELMERAWREKFLFGGAMRQAGMIAAAGALRPRPPRRAARRRPRAGAPARRGLACGRRFPSSSTASRRTSSRSTRRGWTSTRAEVLARLREAGVALSPTFGRLSHPRRDPPRPDDADIDRALELVPAALGAHAARLTRPRRARISRSPAT